MLISEADSTRAISFEALLHTREPFSPTASAPLYGADRRTRVTLFATNLLLQPGEGLSLVEADAEDASHRHYNLTVEYAGPVTGHEWLRQVILRLNPDLGDVGDVLVRITYRGVASNRVRIGIGHTGGGLPDDQGSTPTPPAFTIGRQLQDDRGNGLDGASVVLRSRTDNAAIRTVTTGNGGIFSFAGLPPESEYIVAPANSSTLLFDSQNTGMLAQDLAFTFRATRRVFTISGQVSDGSTGLGGTNVSLIGGGNSRSEITDSNGHYSFSGVPAGNDYQVTMSKTDYIFDPGMQTINFLVSNQIANFTAIRTYRISGRVTDESGNGLIGATMTLRGSAAATSLTSADGSYSFTVTNGDYSVTPSKEQNFYTFSPSSQSIPNITSHQTANFTASYHPTYVLEFDGTPMTVDHGDFWPENVNLGHFFWEFWAMPGENTTTRYLVSDGYGGAHALLFGFNGGVEPGRYNLFGNIFDGVQSTSFASSEGPAPGEWGHFAVGWDGHSIVMYFDGVPVGKQPFAGPRRSMGPAWGAGKLLMGGSDHQNLIGRIGQVRGYETSNPRETSPEASFAPQTVFSSDGNLTSHYISPSQRVADLSSGYNGNTHAGTLRGVSNGILYDCPSCPIPRFVLDPTAPNFSNPSNPGEIITTIDSPPTTPNGVYIFDSFSRQNSTYVLGGRGGLGSTEAGSAGPRPWQSSAVDAQLQPFGILNGRAVLLANEGSVAWVSTGSNAGNLDIRVDRHPHGSGSGVDTGLSFRVLDRNNYFFAYTSDEGGAPLEPKRLNVGYYQSGNRVILSSSLTMPNSWTTLRVITLQSGGISIFADTQLVYSTSSNILTTASGAGLYNCGLGMGLANRWDNFSLFLVP